MYIVIYLICFNFHFIYSTMINIILYTFCLNFWFCLGDWISKSRLLGQKYCMFCHIASVEIVSIYIPVCRVCEYLFHTILAIWAYFCTIAFFYISAHSSLATSAYKSTISSGPDEIFCSVCIFVHFFSFNFQVYTDDSEFTYLSVLFSGDFQNCHAFIKLGKPKMQWVLIIAVAYGRRACLFRCYNTPCALLQPVRSSLVISSNPINFYC